MVVSNGILADSRCNEITWDEFGALMDQLIKCMLSVCARFPPDDRAGLVRYSLPFSINIFTVTFHISLLEISSKAVQVLIIGEYSFRFCLEEIIVPDPNQCQYYRYIAFKCCIGEMLIHIIGT